MTLRITSTAMAAVLIAGPAGASTHDASADRASPPHKGTTTYAAPRHVIAGGGGTCSGGAFAISGTIGQPDADPLQPATGGVFALNGGFWAGMPPPAPPSDPVFGDGFEGAPR